VVKPCAGRGAAFGDLDNDGAIDVVMTVLGGSPLILHNKSSNGNWLTLSLRGRNSNRDGFGARVIVNGQTRISTAAGSYGSSSDKRVHFGLGNAATAAVDIAWPSGIKQHLDVWSTNRLIEVVEPEKGK
jgi:hypothetical protein